MNAKAKGVDLLPFRQFGLDLPECSRNRAGRLSQPVADVPQTPGEFRSSTTAPVIRSPESVHGT
jgi:hypothetical protein